MIRPATMAEQDRVVTMMVDYVARTPYGQVLWKVRNDALKLFLLAMRKDGGFVLVDEVPDPSTRTGLELAGAIVVVCHDYMGCRLAEEVGFWHESPKGVLRLAAAAEVAAVQIRAEVLKMSAPAWTDLGSFYGRHLYEPIETVWVKVLNNGTAAHRGDADSRRSGVLPGPEEEEGRGGPAAS